MSTTIDTTTLRQWRGGAKVTNTSSNHMETVLCTGHKWQREPGQVSTRPNPPTTDRQPETPVLSPCYSSQTIRDPEVDEAWGGKNIPESNIGERQGRGIKGKVHLSPLLQVS